eukprot:CFRG7806T1
MRSMENTILETRRCPVGRRLYYLPGIRCRAQPSSALNFDVKHFDAFACERSDFMFKIMRIENTLKFIDVQTQHWD